MIIPNPTIWAFAANCNVTEPQLSSQLTETTTDIEHVWNRQAATTSAASIQRVLDEFAVPSETAEKNRAHWVGVMNALQGRPTRQPGARRPRRVIADLQEFSDASWSAMARLGAGLPPESPKSKGQL